MFLPPKSSRRRKPASRLPYYPTDPEGFYCWICGWSLDGSGGEWSKDIAPGFAWQGEWKTAWTKYLTTPKYRRRKFSLYMNSSDVAVALKNMYEWQSLFRTSMCVAATPLQSPTDRETHPVTLSPGCKDLPEGYHLSGIGYMPGAKNGQYLLVCRDPATACLGAIRENSAALRLLPTKHPFAFTDTGGGLLKAYTVHSRCWDLIEHEFGSLATSRLDLIVTALQRQWDDVISQLPGPSEYHLAKHQGLDDSEKLRDPMFIRGVETLLQDCKDLSESQNLQATASRSILSSKYNVPLEIVYLIADYLSFRDTCNMLLAFGGELPASYWKRYVPTEILFEFKTLDHDSPLWPYIAAIIETRGILKSDEIWNRKRILGMLKPIKQYINEELKKERSGKQQAPSSGEHLYLN
ncbi:hypothetical protein FQN54_004571 [Arachnomyces sp. PD_36]|nr:hypothetical protein FQN54_004571 [Arachnomyces sp. PD_36]